MGNSAEAAREEDAEADLRSQILSRGYRGRICEFVRKIGQRRYEARRRSSGDFGFP